MNQTEPWVRWQMNLGLPHYLITRCMGLWSSEMSFRCRFPKRCCYFIGSRVSDKLYNQHRYRSSPDVCSESIIVCRRLNCLFASRDLSFEVSVFLCYVMRWEEKRRGEKRGNERRGDERICERRWEETRGDKIKGGEKRKEDKRKEEMRWGEIIWEEKRWGGDKIRWEERRGDTRWEEMRNESRREEKKDKRG